MKVTRRTGSQPVPENAQAVSLSYDDYFTAARRARVRARNGFVCHPEPRRGGRGTSGVSSRLVRVRMDEVVFWLIVAATAAGAAWMIVTL